MLDESPRPRPARSRQLEQLQVENARLRAELAALRGLHELVYRDPLTNLRNRRFFEERMDEELSRARRADHLGRASRCGSLLLVDLDDFKRVNDEQGHLAGDRLLQRVASFLEEGLRTEDVVCRIGGDEFVAILPDTAAEGVRQVASRLNERISGASWLGAGLSLGTATWADDGLELDALVARADVAMYRNKALRKSIAISARCRLGARLSHAA